jgi:hypothetical protein
VALTTLAASAPAVAPAALNVRGGDWGVGSGGGKQEEEKARERRRKGE